ncbi:zinc finger, CCHC-type containing protein [Tanacetum coccineum]
MYGPCLPCGKCARLQQRLQATLKVTGHYKGSNRGCKKAYWPYEGCHIGCRLSRRLPHRWQAAIKVHAIVKAATEACCGGMVTKELMVDAEDVGCCCYEGCNETLWLIQRLPHMLKADAKAAIKVVGFYKGCHIGCRLLQRLPHRLKADAKAAIEVVGFNKGCHIAEKATTLLKRLYRGYGLDILLKTNPNRGSYEGAFYRAFYGAFKEKAKGLRGEDQEIRQGLILGLLQGLQGEGRGASRRRPRVFSELNRGRKRRLHPLGEYIITLYTNGKLRTRVTVMLVSGAKGFRQKEGVNYFDTYAPVARITTIKLLLALVAIHNLVIHQMDVKRVFLNSDLEEEVYMKQPKGFVMPDNKHKFILNQSDKCVYSKFDSSGKGVMHCLYVDDMLLFGTDQNQVDKTKKFLPSKFSMKDMGEADVILDIKIKRENKRIVITQSRYIEKIFKKFNREYCSSVSTPMDSVEKLMPNTSKPMDQLEYLRAIGYLMYAMTSTRPNIDYAVGRLSMFTSIPSRQH